MGFLGDVTLTWQAEPREASVLDFWPSSGTISLKDKEAHTDIVVYILDDTINEPMEVYRLTGTHFFLAYLYLAKIIHIYYLLIKISAM